MLPIGSIVYLKEGTNKLMILSRGALVENAEGLPVLFDYTGCFYPQGVDPENIFYFNHENIDEVLFEGYSDQEEKRFVKLLDEWRSKNKDGYKKVDIIDPL